MSMFCCSRTSPPKSPASEPAMKTMVVKRDFKEHRMGFKKQDMGDLTEEERAAWHRPHYCTDVGALAIFILGLFAMGWVVNYGREHGDLQRLYHGLNFHGELCGVDALVADAPYIFWCSKPGGSLPTSLSEVLDPSESLDLLHPICVSECPTDSTTHHQCYQSKEVVPISKDAITGTFVENVTYNYRLVRDYETRVLAGHYCAPKSKLMMSQLKGKLELTSQAVMMQVGQIMKSWEALAASVGIAVLLGYLYLYLVGRLVDGVIYTFLTLSVILPLLAGGAMLYGILFESDAEEFLEHYGWSNYMSNIPSTGDKRLDLALAFACVAVGVIMAFAACCLRHSVKVIIGIIEASTEALSAMPTLLLAPAASVLYKVVIFSLEFAGLALLLSCGKVSQTEVFEEFVPGGITRKFTFDENEKGYIVVYCFMALWVLNLAFAMEQFILAYGVQLWFFKDYNSSGSKGIVAFPLARGFLTALKFHLGTLALGSLLLSLLEAVHFVLSMVYKRVHDEDSDGSSSGGGNRCGVAKILAGCCCCCMSAFECFIRFMNKNAYIVTAVESKPFCRAAQLAFSVVANEISAIGLLGAALTFFMAVGFVSITSVGAYLTWILVHSVPAFKDPSSEYFVANPGAITGVAAVVSGLVASTFMIMFHTVADTMIFCWALDRKYRNEHGMPPGNHVPMKLRDLLDGESQESLLGG